MVSRADQSAGSGAPDPQRRRVPRARESLARRVGCAAAVEAAAVPAVHPERHGARHPEAPAARGPVGPRAHARPHVALGGAPDRVPLHDARADRLRRQPAVPTAPGAGPEPWRVGGGRIGRSCSCYYYYYAL